MAFALGVVVACDSAPDTADADLTTVQEPSCSLTSADQLWLDRALGAWRFSTSTLIDMSAEIRLDAVIFDGSCVFLGHDAMSTAVADEVQWEAVPHNGNVSLPNGDEIPATVTSFTQSTEESAFFAMSTPSIWRTGGVPDGPLGLETLMVAVLLHEAVHVSQFPTYGQDMSQLSERHDLPESFNDDSIQHRFDQTPEFVASVEAEIDLLLEAAFSEDDAEVRSLARKARQLMQQRRDRWFTGDEAYLSAAEDIWLTLEGSGQWVGYTWLIDEAGHGASSDEALAGFGSRSRWWTQNQGLALALIIDRLDSRWKTEVFRDGGRTLTRLVDDAIDPIDPD